jgi:hypothetical protein
MPKGLMGNVTNELEACSEVSEPLPHPFIKNRYVSRLYKCTELNNRFTTAEELQED